MAAAETARVERATAVAAVQAEDGSGSQAEGANRRSCPGQRASPSSPEEVAAAAEAAGSAHAPTVEGAAAAAAVAWVDIGWQNGTRPQLRQSSRRRSTSPQPAASFRRQPPAR